MSADGSLKTMNQIDTSKIKYVAYARKSTDREDMQVNSLEDQVREIDRMSKGLNVLKTIEESQSAKKLGRPKFAEMMKLIADGKVQGIVCWKINRLARNPVDGGLIVWQLQQGIIKHLKTCDGDYYPDSDMLMLYIHFGMANQFSLNLSKDVTRGMLSKARSGRRPGSAPLGYLNSKVNKKGEQDIIPDPVRGPIIRKMIDLILDGTHNAPQALAVGTEEWGLRTRPTIRSKNGLKLTKSAWYKLLQNPFYYGIFEYPIGNNETEWIDGKHTPLIKAEEFHTIQELLRKSTSKRLKHTFAYMGLMRCGGCGARITCEAKTKNQKNGNVHKYSYYRCTGQVDPNCQQVSIREDRLETLIRSFLSSIEISPEFHAWALEELKNEYEKEKLDRTTILNNHTIEAKRVQDMLDRLLDMSINGHIDPATYATKHKELKADLERHTRYLDLADERVSDWIKDVERLLTFAERAREEFDKGGLEKRRAILAALGTEHVFDKGVLTFQVEAPIEILKNGGTSVKEPAEILEPPKYEEEYTQKGTFVPSSEKMWTLGDSNS